MTSNEFKIKYPQYAHLEGEDLWNKMEDTLLEFGNVLYADPKQDKVFHPPMKVTSLPDEYGNRHTYEVQIEDDSKTRWLDGDGNLVRVGSMFEPYKDIPKGTLTSYSMIIWDAKEGGV